MKHDLYMRLAREVAKEATCPRAKVGAVLVSDRRIVATGYNGAPSGVVHCKDDGCWLQKRGNLVSCRKAVHAELNALVNAAYTGASTKGAVMYCTYSPCVDCLKALINAGVSTVYYEHSYTDKMALRLFQSQALIDLVAYPEAQHV